MGSITPQPKSHKSPEDEPENSVFKLETHSRQVTGQAFSTLNSLQVCSHDSIRAKCTLRVFRFNSGQCNCGTVTSILFTLGRRQIGHLGLLLWQPLIVKEVFKYTEGSVKNLQLQNFSIRIIAVEMSTTAQFCISMDCILHCYKNNQSFTMKLFTCLKNFRDSTELLSRNSI